MWCRLFFFFIELKLTPSKSLFVAIHFHVIAQLTLVLGRCSKVGVIRIDEHEKRESLSKGRCVLLRGCRAGNQSYIYTEI